jgi:hypothetical protein
MSAGGLFNFNDSDLEVHALKAVVSMADGVVRTIYIARTLVENGRIVDMSGLDLGIELLCAKALSLPPHAGCRVTFYAEYGAGRSKQLDQSATSPSWIKKAPCCPDFSCLDLSTLGLS